MRILNLQNTILVSLLVAGAAASAACGSSDASRPEAGAGTSSTSGGTGNATGGTGTAAGTTSGGSTTVAGTTGTSGGSGGSVATGPSVCDDAGSRVLMATAADAFIADFEAATQNPTTMMADATQAPTSWYAFNDVMPTINSVKILREAGMGAGGTGFFGHYMGTGAITPVKGGFGVGVEVNVGVAMDISQFCIDASAFQGVSFWAKAASATNAMITAGFVVPSANQVTNGGDCADTTDAQKAKCNNYPQKAFTLTTDWMQYTVDWAGLKSATGQTVVGNKIQQILWLAPTTDWDFSLDEVAFYKTTPPAGAVAAPATGGGGSGGTGAGGSGGSN